MKDFNLGFVWGAVLAACFALLLVVFGLAVVSNHHQEELVQRATYICLETDKAVEGRCLLAIHKLPDIGWDFEQNPNGPEVAHRFCP